MKIKKLLILVVISASCSAGWPTIVLGQQEKEQSQSVEQLQEKINELEKTIKAQQQTLRRARKAYERAKKQLDEQVKENERLKTLCKEAGVNITKIADATFNPSNIVYRGKKRTQKWFERMYENFYDKIAYADGKYYYIQEEILDQKTIGEKALETGTFARTPNNCKVHKIFSDGEVLIIRPASESSSTVYRRASRYGTWPASAKTYVKTIPELLFHVKGISDNVVDGQPFSTNKLISISSYTYEGRKIQSFIAYEPITRKQFADAIKSGFKLISYRKRGEKIVERPIR